MKKLILIILCLTFVLPFVLANGLQINQTAQNLTKISGSDLVYTFNVKNADVFTFYNISIEPNAYVSTPIIPQLASGQIATVSAVVTANDSFDLKSFKIQGYYYANVGVSNQTYDINVDYYNGLSKCDFSIVRGDKVRWVSKVADDIDLKNVQTGAVVTTMASLANYTTNFDSPQTFKYTFLRRGFVFTPVCTITALSDSGLINNPELDGRLNLSVNVVFNPTTVSYNVLQNNYSITVLHSQDGVLTITNTGNQTARNIVLSGEWFSFNTNNFNIEPGQTKGVVYTIAPLITTTSQTNQTYTKNMLINGNFAPISTPFNVFVPFANLDTSNQTGNYQSLLSLLKQFCKDNPTETFCQDKPNIVYVGNGTDQNFNVTYSTEQVKKIYDFIFKMGDDATVINNWMKENVNNMSSSVQDIKNLTLDNAQRLNALEAERQQNSGNTTMVIVIFIMLGVLALIVTIIIVIRRYKYQSKVARW